MKKFEYEYIDKLRIHELRDYAKQLGVGSPTTKKKSELICSISSIIESRQEEMPKEELDFFELITSDNSEIFSKFIMPADKTKANKTAKVSQSSELVVPKRNVQDLNSPYINGEDLVNLTFNIGQQKAEYCDANSYEVSGYLFLHPSGYGIIRSNGFLPNAEDTYISSATIRKHNLKFGQFVVGRAKHIMADKPRLVYEIVEDNKSSKNRNVKDYDSYLHNGLGTALFLEKFNYEIKRGSRNYIEKMDSSNIVALANEIATENSSFVKLINIKALPEDRYESNEKVEIINAPFNLSATDLIDTINLVVESIKREVEQGKSEVLILYNFCELIRKFNIACEGYFDFGKFNSKAINNIVDILYLAKFIDKFKNCTIICVDKNGIASDMRTLMELEILPLFNKRN